jgi:hypothetical protein
MFIHWGLYAVPAGVYNGKRSGLMQAKEPATSFKDLVHRYGKKEDHA